MGDGRRRAFAMSAAWTEVWRSVDGLSFGGQREQPARTSARGVERDHRCGQAPVVTAHQHRAGSVELGAEFDMRLGASCGRRRSRSAAREPGSRSMPEAESPLTDRNPAETALRGIRSRIGESEPDGRICQRRLKIRPKGGAKDCHLGWWSDLGVRLGVGDAVRGFFGGSGQRSHAELKRSAPAGRPQGGMVYRIGVSLATRALGARCRPGPSDGVPQFSYRHCFCGRGFG